MVELTAKEQGQGAYALQVYKSKDVILDSFQLKNADAGLLVNGSIVTVKNIHTENNEFGGIEVSQGTGVSSPSELTLDGKSTHIEKGVYIWTIGGNSKLVDSKDQYRSGKNRREDKQGYTNYILKYENRNVPDTTLETQENEEIPLLKR